MSPTTTSVRVTAAASGLRLDQAIPELTVHSRTAARKLIERGAVFVDGKRVKVASRLLREGQALTVHAADLPRATAKDEAPPTLDIVHHDPEFIVVNKPSGMFSVSTPESDQHDLIHFLGLHLRAAGESSELHVVHRLDRPTSGLIVVARTKAAAGALTEQLATRDLGRQYRALVAGRFDPAALAVRSGVTLEDGGALVCSLNVGDKEAESRFFLEAVHGTISEVEVKLTTGRTHQIRLHGEALGHPVLGDSKYGRRLLRDLPHPPRLALHAERLSLLSPRSGERLELFAPFPDDLADFARRASD